MDITTTLEQILTRDISDRIRLLQAILESITAEQVDPEIAESQKRELDRRIDNYEMNPDSVLTWEMEMF